MLTTLHPYIFVFRQGGKKSVSRQILAPNELLRQRIMELQKLMSLWNLISHINNISRLFFEISINLWLKLPMELQFN